MKYAIVGLVVVLLAMPIALQMAKGNSTSDEMAIIKGDRFKSPILGFRIELPTKWHQVNKNDGAKNLERVSSEYMEDEKQEAVDKVKDRLIQLFQFTEFPMESATGIISTFNGIAI